MVREKAFDVLIEIDDVRHLEVIMLAVEEED